MLIDQGGCLQGTPTKRATLKCGVTVAGRIYLGMVHNMARFRERVAAARKYLPDFGVGGYCGFGRMPPAEMPRVLQEHQEAMRLLGG